MTEGQSSVSFMLASFALSLQYVALSLHQGDLSAPQHHYFVNEGVGEKDLASVSTRGSCPIAAAHTLPHRVGCSTSMGCRSVLSRVCLMTSTCSSPTGS